MVKKPASQLSESPYEALRMWADQHPDGQALLAPGRSPASYEEILERVESLRDSLLGFGVRAGKRVITLVQDGPECTCLLLSLSSVTVAAPLDPSCTMRELDVFLEQLQPTTAVLPEGAPGRLMDYLEGRGLNILKLVAQEGPAGSCRIEADSLPHDSPKQTALSGSESGLALYTSGSTSIPKLVILRNGQLKYSADCMASVLSLSPADRCLAVMPFFHIHGLSTLFATISSGGSIVCPGRFSEDLFFRCLQEFRPTWYSAAPSIHTLILRHGLSRTTVEPGILRLIRSASGPMPSETLERISEFFAAPFVEAYGMTEASPQIASNGLPPTAYKQGSVGRASGPRIRIFDEAGRQVDPGIEGEIAVRGENVAERYENDAQANTECFRDGWLFTGDLGYLDTDGYLFITGRKKDVINRGGEKVSPREIEEVLLQHPAVLEAVAFPVDHDVLGQDVAAVLVLREGFDVSVNAQIFQTHLAAAVREFAAEKLAVHKLPQTIFFVDSIPIEPGGKVHRGKLASLLADEPGRNGTSGNQARARLDALGVKDAITSIWREVLRVSDPDPDDNFFRLGGHSLAAARVVTRLCEQFDVDMSLDVVFRNPTITQLTAVIGKLNGSLISHSVDLQPSGLHPLSFEQQRLWFLHQLEGGTSYHMEASLHLTGLLDQEALRKSLQELIIRHEILRTGFPTFNSKPCQVVHSPQRLHLDCLAVPETSDKDEYLKGIAREQFTKPYHLDEAALIRFLLIRVSENEHVLLINMHHIIADAWSVGVLYRDLAALYNTIRFNRSRTIPHLPLQFKDHAILQRERLQGKGHKRLLEYWTHHLKDPPSSTELPMDRPNCGSRSDRGAAVHGTIPSATASRLKSIAVDEQSTSFMAVLASFFVLLHRYSNQCDLIVGTPVANRPSRDTENLIGFFANTVVLRASVEHAMSYRELLHRTREVVLDALANQELPFDHLVESINPERHASQSPLFQVMFVYQTSGERGPAEWKFTDDLVARPYRSAEAAGSKFDLTLYATETEGGFNLRWQYSTDLFDQSTIEGLNRHFLNILKCVAIDPDHQVSRIRMMDSVDLNSVSNGGVLPLPQFTGGAHGLLELQAAKTPDRVAIKDRFGEITYKKLNNRAEILACHLCAVGVETGTIVAILPARSSETLICIFAVWKAGGTYLPLDPESPPARNASIINEAGARHVISEKALQSNLEEILSFDKRNDIHSILGDDLPDVEVTASASERGTEDLAGQSAYIIHTSGSTGTSVGVVVTHANVCHYVQAMLAVTGVNQADCYLHTAPFSFSSSIRQYMLPLSCGASLHIADRDLVRDPQSLMEQVRRSGITVMDIVPSYWRVLLQVLREVSLERRAALLGNDLRLVLSASETLDRDTLEEWWNGFNQKTKVINMYGQTETTGIVSTHVLSPEEPGSLSSAAVPIGRPIPGCQLYVLDSNSRQVPIGVSGEICVEGPTIGRGYLGTSRPERNRFCKVRVDGGTTRHLYRTGDTGRYRSDGTLEYLGRADSQLKVRGHRVHPAEIESAVRSHADITECALVSDTNGDGSDRIVAFVVPVSEIGEDEQALSRRLRVYLSDRLPRYMIPSRFISMDSLPLTTTGKLDRHALLNFISPVGRSPGGDDGSSMTSGLEQAIPEGTATRRMQEVWKKILRIEEVGIEDNFFDLGGDSLLSVELVMEADRAGVPITLKQLFQHQTILELVQSFEESRSGENPAAARHRSDFTMSDPVFNREDDADCPRYTSESLRSLGREILERAGLESAGAAIVAEVQLESSLRGQLTHNIGDIPRYARRIKDGVLNPTPKIVIERETDITALVDGDNAPGQWVATIAMETAIRKARESGVGIVGVRRSNHFGAAGHYTWLAAQQDLIGLCTTNGPLILAPAGGVTPTFGNNPISVGLPAGQHFPIVLDIAMSVAPRGKIGLSLQEGQPLASGWILDESGRPTTDLADLAAGLGMPVGAHKGYGLAFVFEALAGVLTGAGFCHDHSRHGAAAEGETDLGHLFAVIDPEIFIELNTFKARLDRMIVQTKKGRLAAGSREILVPGEREHFARVQNIERGVAVRPSTLRKLMEHARRAGIASVPRPC